MDMIEITPEIREVIDKIENYRRPLFVSGKAGTGKTTLIRLLVESAHANVVVVAPTGVAAVNAGGVTIHSQFNVPVDCITGSTLRLSDKKREVLKNMDILIIDEISMVRPDVIDYVRRRLEYVRMNRSPWGGVRVVMFGDLFQLPPIIPEAEREVFYDKYAGPYFFYARAFENTGIDVVSLSRVFRQSEKEFVGVLNKIRVYEATDEDFAVLNSRVRKNLGPDTVNICSYRADAANINRRYLEKLARTKKARTYTAEYEGRFSPSAAPVPDVLELCPGARVMVLVNDPDGSYCNGSLGEVVSVFSDRVDVVLDSTGEIVTFEPHTWEQQEYVREGRKISSRVCGTCTQIPLNLAWAVTIHKSQGLTFDKAYLKVSDVFSPGQLYVALSRCRTLDGLSINAPVTPRLIYADKRLVDFERVVNNNHGWFRAKDMQ